MAAHAIDRGFAVTLGDDQTLTAAKLVLPFGISDVLPDLPGLAERWGTSVLHCPYRHGSSMAGAVSACSGRCRCRRIRSC